MALIDFFIERDKNPKKKTSGSSTYTPPQTVSLNPPSTIGTGLVTNEDVLEFEQQFRNILAEENKRNYPGNDWFEFNVMKNAMNAVPQEDVRYQAAFSGWATGGNQSKKTLLETANIYLGLVDREIKEFGDAFKTKFHEKVTRNEELIKQKSDRIQKLAEEMAILNQEVANLKAENAQNTVALQTKHDAFMAAGGRQRTEILAEIDKINKYIQ